MKTSRKPLCEACSCALKLLQFFSGSSTDRSFSLPRDKPGGGTPYSGLYGEAPPEKGAFFQATGI